MIISGEEIRKAAAKHEENCPSAMKGSFYYGFREGAKWMQKELLSILENNNQS